jgi:hypothetical protein
MDVHAALRQVTTSFFGGSRTARRRAARVLHATLHDVLNDRANTLSLFAHASLTQSAAALHNLLG